jgi:hypothetical protein
VAVDNFGFDFACHSNLIISVVSNAAGLGVSSPWNSENGCFSEGGLLRQLSASIQS